MNKQKEIVTQLKQDIYTLWNIARSYTDGEVAQKADELHEMIIAGLTDYELSWRGYFGGEE